MKKILFAAAVTLLMLGGTAYGQKDSVEVQCALGVQPGVETYFGHPRLSVSGQGEESLRAMSLTAYVGFGKVGRSFHGVDLGVSCTELPAYSESVNVFHLNYMWRIGSVVRNNFQASFGLSVGPALFQNRYTFNSESQKANTFGLNAGLTLNLHYFIDKHTYVGADAELRSYSTYKGQTFPTGEAVRLGCWSYKLGIVLGVKF